MLDYRFKNCRILANLTAVQILLRPNLAHNAPSCMLHERRETLPLRNHQSNRGFLGCGPFRHPTKKKWVLWSTQLMGYQMAIMLFVGKITSNLNRINQIQFWRKMIPVPSTPNRPHDSRSPRSSDHRCTCKVARSTPAVVRALMHTTGRGALHQLELGAV